MAKQFWKGSALLSPVPAALVSCGTPDSPNVLTIGWTGIICTHPPMTYISVRPQRFSYDIIKNSGEFVINLTTAAMCRQVDLCGVKSGRDTDKLALCGFHAAAAHEVTAPVIEECPVSLECRVTEEKPLGTHNMFLAEIVGIDVDEELIDENGRLDMAKCGLMAYAHGEYFSLGKSLGTFGWSVRKKKKSRSRKKSG